MILKTCSNIEKPPKPNKKEQIKIQLEIIFVCIFEIKLTPFVNSIIPLRKPQEKLEGKPNADNN